MNKLLLSLFLASSFTFSSCSQKFTGQLVHKGQAIKVIQDDVGGSVLRTSLNGESFELQRKEKLSFGNWKYEKVKTKFGELEVVRDMKMGLIDNRTWWDYYIDGAYTGTINLNHGGLTTGPAPRVQN